MKKWLLLSVMVVLVVFVVTSCTLTLTIGGKVSGTITLVGKAASGASVTLQQGSSVYGASIFLSGIGTQTGTFSVDVPFGTYTVYVDFYSNSGGYSIASYLINGFGPSPLAIGGALPHWTETIVAVPVNADTRIDTYLN